MAVVDALAQTSRIFYAGSGLITNIVDPFGRGMTVIYSNNHVATVRDMGGVESRYTFYTNGLQKDYVQSLRTDCGDVSFTYALADGNPGGTWDRSTLTATFADGSTEILHYTGTGLTRFTDRNGYVTEYAVGLGSAFPYQGRIDSAKFPDNTQVSFQYNAALQVTNVTDEATQKWAYVYNAQGRLTEVRTPGGYQVAYAYTNGGFDLVRVTEAATNVLASISYTPKRDVETITNAVNQAIRFGYDSYGRLTNAVDALNLETVMEYGPNFWPSAVKRAGITLATFQQDPVGRTTNAVGPENIAIAFSFDDLNRISALKIGVEQPYRWTYNTNSLLLASQTDRSGRRTKLEYDSMERIRRVLLPDTSFAIFEYDHADNLTALLDGSGNKTRFLFDARNRLIQKTHPGGDSASISYDARGLPVTHTGGRGVETALKYNGDGFLTNVSYSATNTPSVRYTFNNRRQLVGMADGWSTNSYRYDAQGRLTNIVEVFGASSQTWGYAFDALGRVTAVTWRLTGNTNVFTMAYSYDELGRVTNVAGDLGNFGYAYTNAGLQVSRLTYPNGETASYSYDQLARLTNLAYSTGEQWSYAYDSRDFVTRRVDPAGGVYAYAYDEAGRLIAATGLKGTNIVSGHPYRYGYDRAGNRIRQTEGQKQRKIKVNSNNQPIRFERTNSLSVRGYVNEPGSRVEVRNTASTNWYPAAVRYVSATQAYFEAHNVLMTNIYPLTNTILVRATDVANNVSTSRVGVVSFGPATQFLAYDADGNRIEFFEGWNRRTNSWDAENRLIRVDYTNGNTRLRYDGWGRLREVAEYNAANTLTSLVRYAWNGFLPWAELNSSNGVIRTFSWGVDLSGTIGGAGGIGGLVGMRSYAAPATNYYVRQDGKGNVTDVRRQNGTVAASYGYSPFGALLYQTNTYNQPFRFQTKLHHARSGYSSFGYRWYDCQAGGWLSRDPINENGGINLYQYVGNNPVNFIDPDGKILLQVGGAVIGGSINAIKNYSAYKSGYISGSDYAKSIAFGAGAGVLSTLVPGVAGVFAGGALAGANDILNQSIDSRNCGLDYGQAGTAAALGVAAGSVGYLGQSIGRNLGYYPDQIGKVLGSNKSLFQDYSDVGGLVGLSVGTLLTEGVSSQNLSQATVEP